MHCQNPPCADLCPWGAARKLKNGITLIDDAVCLGGSKCRDVCPWKIPQRQTGVGLYLDLMPSLAGNGVMYKCDRCYDRLADGETPACIEACPEDVQTIGPRDEIIKKAHALADEINGYIYSENENGGTNTIYVSPVPFEELNKTIEKGKGKPHLKPVENTMARANNLAAAMVERFWDAEGGEFYFIRAAHLLPNGNIFIIDSRGQFIEVTREQPIRESVTVVRDDRVRDTFPV